LGEELRLSQKLSTLAAEQPVRPEPMKPSGQPGRLIGRPEQDDVHRRLLQTRQRSSERQAAQRVPDHRIRTPFLAQPLEPASNARAYAFESFQGGNVSGSLGTMASPPEKPGQLPKAERRSAHAMHQ
jgi:hypothetical protein